MSENDIHYGPIIPGEKELKLIHDLTGASVLDLGCGAGHNLMAMKNLGAKSGFGIDFCEEQIKRAKEKVNKHFEFIVGNISDLTLVRKEKFDLVISVFAISFIGNLDNLFNIIAQNLKPGGNVIISTDHPDRKLSDTNRTNDSVNNHSRLRYWNIPNEDAMPYIHYLHSYEEITSALKKSGLILDDVITPQVLPMNEIEKAPYRSAYYIHRHKEMTENPYTIIFKAYKPL